MTTPPNAPPPHQTPPISHNPRPTANTTKPIPNLRTPRSRTPLLILAATAAGALFIGLRWQDMAVDSEGAKRVANKREQREREREKDYGVVTGRSGGGV